MKPIIYFTGVLIFVATGYCQELQLSTHDGVYTLAQANQGKELYERRCISCHFRDLSGGPKGGRFRLALIGERFTKRWNGASLRDFADYIDATMPYDAPGLRTSKLNKVVAYILQVNGCPEGDNNLDLGGAFDTSKEPKPSITFIDCTEINNN